jgi:hypothetical protein
VQFYPQVAKTDGKLWSASTGDGVGVNDRATFPSTSSRRRCTRAGHADRKTQDASSTLACRHLSHLEIDYTALSLSRWRRTSSYKPKVATAIAERRQSSTSLYNDLPPGNYLFRVVASNNSGVWNEQGASLDF